MNIAIIMKRLPFYILSLILIMACTPDEPKPVAYPTDSILLRTHQITMVPGEEWVLHVDYYTATPFTWTSTDSTVVRVSTNGIIQALHAGSAAVVVACADWTTATDTVWIEVHDVPAGTWLPEMYLDFHASKDETQTAIRALGYEPYSGDSIGFRTVNSLNSYLFNYATQDATCYQIRQYVYGWEDSIRAALHTRYVLEDSVPAAHGYTYYMKTVSNRMEIRVTADYFQAYRGGSLDHSFFSIVYYPLQSVKTGE